MPFNPMTLQVFGDSTTFSPFKKPIREELVELAEKYKWNAHTTKERLRLGLSFMKDRFSSEILDGML
jgi:hypothetical protein